MTEPPKTARDEAVLILAPLLEDEAALRDVAAAEGEGPVLATAQSFAGALDAGAGCLILTEEMLVPEILDPLLAWAEAQPAWSALPVLILTRNAALLPHPVRGVLAQGRPAGLQITLLNRPSAPELLRNAIRNAMDARRRQYLIRDQIEELEASREQLKLLGREVQHRAKNSLTRISAILRQTWRNAKSPEQFVESLERRIGATARGLDLMTQTGWQGAKLDELFKIEAHAIFGEKIHNRLVCDGEEVALNYEAALALHLVAHELATNALKYGAFSTPQGQVSVRWRRMEEGDDARLELFWEETGGPAVSPPEAKGFGSKILEQALTIQIGGYVQTSFRTEGLRCRVILPLADIVGAGAP